MTRLTALVIGLLLAGSAPVSAQCIMCRTALATPEGQAMIGAFQNGILFLLAVPFLAFGTIAYLAVRGQKRAVQGS